MSEGTAREADRKRRARRLTLGDLAAELDVSTATVSLALRDSPLVAGETRKRIKRHAIEVGYIYNRSAAALRTARSNMIGIAVHDILNPYFAEVFRALEDELEREHQVVLICNHRDDATRQRNFVDSLLQHRIDGLVLCASVGTTAEEINAIARSGIPVTLICRDVEGAEVPVVRGDDVAGARALTEHLIARGHRHIAMVGGRRQSSAGRDRNLGWRQALEAAGIDPAAQLDLPELMTQSDGRDAVPRLLAARPRPTAVFGFNDLLALGMLSALRRAGVEPGRDMAIVGYDDTDGAATRTPALTSVWNCPDEIGRRAADLILRQIAGEKVGAARLLIAPELRIRESSPPPLKSAGAPG
ncbi:LacI family DNA-binding transcriptional regulator [Stappia indica]|uniref:LacI family DNA-binding transcriptional regulator n=1 Tax=Stappia indica TaxID=538381 RepID=UPI001CD2BFB9|nr:LacI family DNA-binding transcriptional regulator [Stappia indica]MCA1298326.1 LacI family transcriptional regulator [Stappia indica]